MANKRLSLQDVDNMKNMVLRGVAPEDIAKHFNIAISSVHNYKNRFKKEGLKFPDVRGKRPTGSVDVKSSVTSAGSGQTVTGTGTNMVNFVVNGVSVQVSSDAKNVSINKDKVEISF